MLDSVGFRRMMLRVRPCQTVIVAMGADEVQMSTESPCSMHPGLEVMAMMSYRPLELVLSPRKRLRSAAETHWAVVCWVACVCFCPLASSSPAPLFPRFPPGRREKGGIVPGGGGGGGGVLFRYFWNVELDRPDFWLLYCGRE